MAYYEPCEICKSRPATQAHHLLPQTKYWTKLYKDYIHDKRNFQYICANCHNGFTAHISEEEFCKRMGIEPRSKEYKIKKMRLGNE